MLKCWNVEMLKCWNVEMLRSKIAWKLAKCFNVGNKCYVWKLPIIEVWIASKIFSELLGCLEGLRYVKGKICFNVSNKCYVWKLPRNWQNIIKVMGNDLEGSRPSLKAFEAKKLKNYGEIAQKNHARKLTGIVN